MAFSVQDKGFMEHALRLAALGRGRTHPNPMVGCVIVKDGQVVGNGYHRKAGEPHAEAYALEKAGDAARGATAYITLEPCAHQGRTPPCADALLTAGISRVIAAMVDPDPRVSGKGLERLRQAGVEVESGLLEEEARSLNRAYIQWQTTGRPLVILKWAMTLDGKIAAVTGDSRWVTGESARGHLHTVRDQVDAILVGLTTARLDDPELTARPTGPGPLPGWAGGIDPGSDPVWVPKDPLRVVVDSLGRIDLNARVFSPELLQRPNPNRTVVAVTPMASFPKLQAIRELGAEVWEFPERQGVVALEPLLDELGRRGVTCLLVEGGGKVHWSFLAQGLADYLMVYVAPKAIGGAGAPGPVAGDGLKALADAWRTGPLRVTPIGEDVLLEGELAHPMLG